MRVGFHSSARWSLSLLLLFLLLIPGIWILDASGAANGSDHPPLTRAEGPIVNRSVVDIVLYEGFEEKTDSYFNATGYGMYDLFYDPNYEWKEGPDIPYPLKAFEVRYPSPYSKEDTPIKVEIVTYFEDTSFGRVTISNDPKYEDFNNIIYGQEWFTITIIGRNGSGESQAQIRFKVLNVNDPPTVISDKAYFAISFNEDTEFQGINKDHDQLVDIFGDLKDPFDTLTFTYEAVNELAENITVLLSDDGSSVRFIPPANWSCPYLPRDQRERGRNIGGSYPNFFAVFNFICTDDGGLSVDEDDRELDVYVGPVNDPPQMTPLDVVKIDEDVVAEIQLEAHDVDENWDQSLRYGTNLTTSVYEQTGVQVEFQEDYSWDEDTGLLRFRTTNDLVGTYQIEAYVRDRSTEGPRPDYPVTPYKVYSNFTLIINNINDAPMARIDQPISSFIYNTSSLIEFNASRSTDIDISHGDFLNYTWTLNGVVLGYGPLLHRMIEEPGTHNVTVNVTDSTGAYSLAWVEINVEKARVLGEIFYGKDLERSYFDNDTAIVISKSQDELKIYRGGQYSLDITSVTGTQKGALYKIQIRFDKKLDFLYTEELIQEPSVELYFLTPGFKETRVSLSLEDAMSYVFPVPFSNVRYTRLEYNLRGPSALYPPMIAPLDTIRMLDDGMGVEITLTVVEMDELGIRPDFELYAVAHLVTTIMDVNGQTLEQLTSWDSAGYNTTMPEIVDVQDVSSNGKESNGIPLIVWIMLIIVLLLVIGAVVLVLFLVTRKKEEEPEPLSPVREVTVEEEIFGQEQGPVYPDARQLYGGQVRQDLPPQQQEQQGLPPAQAPTSQNVSDTLSRQ